MNLLSDKIKNFCSRFYRVPYCVPNWNWEEHWIIFRCLITGKIIDGSNKEKLYNFIRDKTGMKYIFGFDSGQEAITAALLGWDVGIGDKIIMPSYCCETVAKAVLDTGAKPVFCDINDQFNPDINHILAILDDSIKAIIFPHLFGNPGDISKLEAAISEKRMKNQILLIDDAAQSFGAVINNKLLGTFGDAGIISFGPGKTVTATGGGLLITNSENLNKKISNLTIDKLNYSSKIKKTLFWLIFRRWRRYTYPFYQFVKTFFIMRNSDKMLHIICNVDAAIAYQQLKKLPMFLTIRLQRKEKLDILLSQLNNNSFSILPANEQMGHRLNIATKYVLYTLSSGSSKAFTKRLATFFYDSGIEILPLYRPIHMYSNLNFDYVSSLPITEKLYDQVFQIPLEPSINDKDFDYIVERFFDFTNYELYKK